jgi:hypothetical protein
MIHISTDRRFRCSVCYTGFDPVDARVDCLECFGSSYRANVEWITGMIVKPARSFSDSDRLDGYENLRKFRLYFSPEASFIQGDNILEINPSNQKDLKHLSPPIAILHSYTIDTVEAMYYDAKLVCYQATCTVEDQNLTIFTKLLAQL